MKKNNFYNYVSKIFTGAFMMIGISYIIALIFSFHYGNFSPAPPELTHNVGLLKACVMMAFYSAIVGGVFARTKFIWNIKDWSILKSSLIYFSLNLTVTSFCGYNMYWFSHSLKGYIPFLSIFVIIFLFIWLICYFNAKKESMEMNKKLREKKMILNKFCKIILQ